MQMYDFQPSLHFSCDLPIIAQPASPNKCFVSYFRINLFFNFTQRLTLSSHCHTDQIRGT